MKLLKKTSRMFAIIGTGVLSLCATIACTVSTMAWYSHLNTDITSEVETGSPNLTITNTDVYKLADAEMGGDPEHGTVVDYANGTTNSDQGIDDGYDGPSSGYGYYLLGNAEFVDSIAGSSIATDSNIWKYSTSQKMEDNSTNNPHDRAKVLSLSLEQGAKFAPRYHGYDSTNSEITDFWCNDLEYDYNQGNPTEWDLADGKTCVEIKTSGIFDIYLKYAESKYRFFITYRVPAFQEDTKREPIRTSPKKVAYTTDSFLYVQAGVWNADNPTIKIQVRWHDGSDGEQWSTSCEKLYDDMYKISLPNYGNAQRLRITRWSTDGNTQWGEDSHWVDHGVDSGKVIVITGWNNSYQEKDAATVVVKEVRGNSESNHSFTIASGVSRNTSTFIDGLNQYYGYTKPNGFYTASSGGSAVSSVSSSTTIYAIYSQDATKTVYFDAGSDHGSYQSPYIHAWDSKGINQSFPGAPMGKASTTKKSVYGGFVWEATVPATSSVIFSPGSNVNKTGNLDLSNVADGSAYLLYQPGSGNWRTPITFTTDVDGVTTDYFAYSNVAFTLPTLESKTGYTNKWYTSGGTPYDSGATGFSSASDITLYAYKANSYNVSLSLNYAEGSPTWKTVSATYDSVFPTRDTSSSALVAPTRTNYTFGGFYGDSNCEGTQYYDASMNPTSATWTTAGVGTIYAKWTPNVYSITLDNNSADSAGTATIYEKYNTGFYKEVGCTNSYDTSGSGKNITVPTKTGYDFGGYYTGNGENDAWGTQVLTSSGYLAANNLATSFSGNGTLYAKWVPKTYNVTLDSNGADTGHEGESSVTATFASGLPSIAANLPTREGYAFEGYYTSNDNGETFVTKYINSDGTAATNWNIDSATTLYAKWVVWTVIIEYDGNENTGGTDPAASYSGEKTVGSIPVAANTYTKTGYNFSGWDVYRGNVYVTNIAGGESHLFLVSEVGTNGATLTLKAHWTAKTTTVTLNKQNGTGGDSSVTATYDSAMPSATMPTRSGYTFMGYFTQTGGGGVKYYNADGSSAKKWDIVDSTKTLYAHWDANTYVITLSASEAGNEYSTSPTSDATFGSSMPSITTLPTRTGYRFAGYFTSGGVQYYLSNGSSAKNWDIASDTTLVAHWDANTYTIVFAAGTGGSGNMSDMDMTYGSAKSLTSNAFTRTGYHFNGWSGSNGGSYTNGQSVSNLTAVHEGTVTLTAQWAANTYTIVFNGHNNTSGSMSNQGFTYDSAQNLSSNSFVKTNFTFAGWDTNSAGTTVVHTNGKSVSNLTAENGATINLYAVWTRSITLYHQNKANTTTNITVTWGAAMPSGVSAPSARNNYTFEGYYDTDTYKQTDKYYDDQMTSKHVWNDASLDRLYASWTVTTEGYYLYGEGIGTTQGQYSDSWNIEDAVLATGGKSNPETGENLAEWISVYIDDTTDSTSYPVANDRGFKIVYIHANGSIDWQEKDLDGNHLNITGGSGSNINCSSAGYYKVFLVCTNSGSKTYKIAVNRDVAVTTYEIYKGNTTAKTPYTGNTDISLNPATIVDENEDLIFTAYTGYNVAYYTDAEGTHAWQVGAPTTITLTLYAIYTPISYEVTLNVNGATSGDNKTISVTYDAAMPSTDTSSIVLTAPSRTGYRFLGYWTCSDAGITSVRKYYTNNMASFANWAETEITVLYAMWEKKVTTITFDFNGKTPSNTPTGSVVAEFDSQMPAIAVLPQHATYAFVGYFDSEGTQYYYGSGSSAKVWDIDLSTATLYAHWSLASVTFTFDGNSQDSGTAPANGTATLNVAYTFPTNTGNLAKDTFSFAGWNTRNDGSGITYHPGQIVTFTEIEEGSVTLYALWVSDQVVYIIRNNANITTEKWYSINVHYWFEGNQANPTNVHCDYLQMNYSYYWYYAVTIPYSAKFIVYGRPDDQSIDNIDNNYHTQDLDFQQIHDGGNNAILINGNKNSAVAVKLDIVSKTIFNPGQQTTGYIIRGNETFSNDIEGYWDTTNIMGLYDSALNFADKIGLYIRQNAAFHINYFYTNGDADYVIVPYGVTNRWNALGGGPYDYATTSNNEIVISNSGSYNIYLSKDGSVYLYRRELYLYVYRTQTSTWDAGVVLGLGDGNPYLALAEFGVMLNENDVFLVTEVSQNACAAYGYGHLVSTVFAGQSTTITSKNVGLPESIQALSQENGIKISRSGCYVIYLRGDNTKGVEIYDVPEKGDGYYITNASDDSAFATSVKMKTISDGSLSNVAAYLGYYATAGKTIKIRSNINFVRSIIVSGTAGAGVAINNSSGTITITNAGYYDIYVDENGEFRIDRSYNLKAIANSGTVEAQNTSLVVAVTFTANNIAAMNVKFNVTLSGTTSNFKFAAVTVASTALSSTNPYAYMHDYAYTSHTSEFTTAGSTNASFSIGTGQVPGGTSSAYVAMLIIDYASTSGVQQNVLIQSLSLSLVQPTA